MFEIYSEDELISHSQNQLTGFGTLGSNQSSMHTHVISNGWNQTISWLGRETTLKHLNISEAENGNYDYVLLFKGIL